MKSGWEQFHSLHETLHVISGSWFISLGMISNLKFKFNASVIGLILFAEWAYLKEREMVGSV